MQIVQTTYIGNIYTEMAKQAANGVKVPEIIDLSKPENRPQREQTGELVTNHAEFFAAREAEVRANYASEQAKRHEAFYSPNETLTGYVPGGYSIDTEIMLAIETGYAAIDSNGQVVPGFSEGSQLMNERSPLKFAQQLENLQSLYNSLGEDASKYDDKFNAALDKIIAGLFDNRYEHSGMYINADKEGVANSIKAAFYGENVKYSVDDIKSMIILDYESMSKSPKSDSEYHLGAMLGFDAAAITAMQKNGKLSDSAAATVWDAFNKRADEVIAKANRNIDLARNDPYMPKSLSYSPINKELIYDSINAMIDAAMSDNFAAGLRNALSSIAEMRDARIASQQEETGMYDQRYANDMLRKDNNYSQERAFYFNRDVEIASSYLSQYMSAPSFAVSGNALGNVDVKV